jgi:hypothetical protein
MVSDRKYFGVLMRDDCDGQGDLRHCIAYLIDDRLYDNETDEPLIQYSNDEILGISEILPVKRELVEGFLFLEKSEARVLSKILHTAVDDVQYKPDSNGGQFIAVCRDLPGWDKFQPIVNLLAIYYLFSLFDMGGK